MTSKNSTQEESFPQEGRDDQVQGKSYRKNYRFDQRAIDNLEALKLATGMTNETELTAFAYQYTARHLSPLLETKPSLSRAMLHDIAGVVAILCAYFAEAERTMKEQGADMAEVQAFGTELLLHIEDPIYLASVLVEQIGDRPVWLRHSWKIHFQYEQAGDLLERYVYELHDRYSLGGKTNREEDEDVVLEGEEEKSSGREIDPEADEDEPSIRLYPGDIYALYDDTFPRQPEYEAAFVHGLRQSLGTFIPHLGKKDQKRGRVSEKA